MKIAIIGTGYVGLVTGTCFAELGNYVTCVDIDEKKIKKLNKGINPIYEPGLSELIVRNLHEKRLNFTTTVKSAIEKAEVVFSAVGTPQGKNHSADIRAVLTVANEFGRYCNNYKLFVNKSTVPVGTSSIIKKEISKYITKSAQFDVVDNPEFLREGSAIKDFMTPDRIIVGVDSAKAMKTMNELYKPFVRAGNSIIFTDLASAEIIKYASNAFLAVKISYINEIANMCELVGADIKEVSKGIGLDPRIGPRFLHAGIGYGGSCFPKDIRAFIQTAKQVNSNLQILEAVERVNTKQKTLIIEKLKKKIPSLRNKHIAIWGLSFKPKTDDIREAPSIKIIKILLKEGAKVQAFDPVAMQNIKKVIKDNKLIFHDDPYSALKNSDALLVLTEWDEFRSIDFDKMKKLMNKKIILDGRNIYDPFEMRNKGFIYDCIGRSMKYKKSND